jgi:hypothetical protein
MKVQVRVLWADRSTRSTWHTVESELRDGRAWLTIPTDRRGTVRAVELRTPTATWTHQLVVQLQATDTLRIPLVVDP